MTALLSLALLLQVDAFKIESKKITPEIRKQIEKLDAIRNEAFEFAKKNVAAKLPEEFQVILEAVDGADPDPAKFTRHSGLAAETSSKDFPIARIRFYVEYFANGLGTPESTLRHEMVHAVMRLDLGNEKYGKLPKWFREGIAVYIAGQMPDKLAHELMQPKVAKDPETLLDGLEDADHNLSDYWEDAMAIVLLGTVPTRAPLWQVIDHVRDGKDYKEAIAAVTGKPFEDFLKDAREHAAKSLRSQVAQGRAMYDAYAEIARLNEGSGAACEDFLKKWPKSPLRSAVLYYRAKAAKDEGLADFDAFLVSAREPNGKADFIDDALLRKARLLAKKDRLMEAGAVYADLVKWHIGSSAAIDALFEWGLMLIQMDRYRGSPLLRRALELAPKHKLAERAEVALDY